ncbi:MAG: HlyC/CorC family transporter [Hyphomicrobiales bacterium]|nr:HlyC/CorC family transporter [Hyphomicrobiales bacterium]
MEILVTLLIMLLCLMAEAFFSGSEIGVISADRMQLRHDAANGSRGAKLALKMLEKPEWLLSTTLVGTNIAVVTNTTMGTALVIQLLGEPYSWVAVVVVAPLIWIFGEIVPKSIFQQRANAVTPTAIFVLRFASYLFAPILFVFSGLSRLVTRMFGSSVELNPFTLREEIVTMMDMSPVGGDIEPHEQSMIQRVFDFSETETDEILVPLIDVTAISRDATCGEATRLAVENAHKRLPVFQERIDNIVGIINTLDMLGTDPNAPIEPHVRPIRYVPESKSIEDLLLEMRREGDTVVVVVDEFGGAEGIVTLEDILEEVVGELEDEYDAPDDSIQIRRIDERTFVVGARVEIDVLNRRLGLSLPEGDYETLGGFIIEQFKDIPARGERLTWGKLTLTIEHSTPQAVQDVRLRW